jgi:hypothetical protein
MLSQAEKQKRAAELVQHKRSPADQLKHLDRKNLRAVKERAKIAKRLAT